MRTPKQIMADVKAQYARENKQAAEELVMPPPEVYARPAAKSEIPRGAKKFIKLADEVTISYARGPIKKLKPPRWEMADSVLVRGRLGQRRFSAVWLNNGFDCGFAHGVGRVNATQLEWYLTQDVDIPWLEGYGCLTRN